MPQKRVPLSLQAPVPLTLGAPQVPPVAGSQLDPLAPQPVAHPNTQGLPPMPDFYGSLRQQMDSWLLDRGLPALGRFIFGGESRYSPPQSAEQQVPSIGAPNLGQRIESFGMTTEPGRRL